MSPTPLFSAVLTLHLGSSANASNIATGTTTHSHVLIGSTSAIVVNDTLATELEAQVSLSMSGVAGPSQPILSGSSPSTTEPTLVNNTLATGYDTSELLGPSQPTFDGTSTVEFTMVDNALAAEYDTSQFLSTPSDPSQLTFDLGVSTSAAEFTTADNILTTGYEVLQLLSTLSDPTGLSQPTFDLSIPAAQFTTTDCTLATGYDTLQLSSTLSGPSQPFFDLGAGTSAPESTTVEGLLAAGYEMIQYLSTLPDSADPPQPTLDPSAGIPAAGFMTTGNTLATRYDVSQPIFDMGAGYSTAEFAPDDDDELVAELTAELNALLPPSTPLGGTSQFTPSRNGPKQRRNARASSKRKLTTKPSLYPPIQGEPSRIDFAGVPSNSPNNTFGSDNQQSMATFDPFLPGDRAVDISDTLAMGYYPFSFNFSALGSARNVNAPQPSTSVPGTIGGTPNFFNDAGTSNVFGGATIGANKQAEAVFSTQMSQPLFDLGMTGGQLSSMDTATYKDPVPMLGVGAGSSVVDTMQSTSSSLFNTLSSQHVSTPGSMNILRTLNTGGSESTDVYGR